LLRMYFQESKWLNMCRRPGPRYRELAALPRPLIGQRGMEGKGGREERMGTGNEERVRNRYGIQERRNGEKEGEERRKVCPQLQLLYPPVFAKQFHTVKTGGHRVRGCLCFTCGEGWMIPWTSNGGNCRLEDRGG